MKSNKKELNCILVCDLFFMVIMDITWPLPKTICRNKYMSAIDHYLKLCEAKAIIDWIVVRTSFLINKSIPKHGIPWFILTNNGGERLVEFNVLFQDYGSIHQHIMLQWPHCNVQW